MTNAIRRLYFAGHHFTRDLIGTIAPVTASALAFVALYPPLRSHLTGILERNGEKLSFWGFVLVLCVYAVCAYFVGAMANIVGNFVHRIWQRIPRIGEKTSYTYWYKQNSSDIDAMFNAYFPEHKGLGGGAAVSPTDKINALKEYFRFNNPNGYIETYRQFLKVDMVRTTFLYSFGFAVFCAYKLYLEGLSVHMAVLGVAAFLLAVVLIVEELPRRVRKVARSEFTFIIATARIKRDREATAS